MLIQRVECVEVIAYLNFLRDLAVGCYEGDDVNKWEDLPKDEQQLYLEEAKIAPWVLSLEDMKAILKLSEKCPNESYS
jgi:hypothetical protein